MLKLRNYDQDSEVIAKFLKEFYINEDDGAKTFIYALQLTKVANREAVAFVIKMDHVFEYDENLGLAIESNALRYQILFSNVVDDLLPEYRDVEVAPQNVLDIFIDHRIRMEQRLRADQAAAGVAGAAAQPQPVDLREVRSKFPPTLLRRYELYFAGRSNVKPKPLRSVQSSSIGKLIQINGLVTRATDVKPQMQVSTYTCDRCGAETYQEITGTTFMPLTNCMTEACRQERTAGGRLHLQTRGSKFMKFQELKLQELAEQVPVGSIPRTMTVYCRGENTRCVQPGDHVHITGVFLPIVKSGYRSGAQGLLNDTFLEAFRVEVLTKDQDQMEMDDITQEEKRRLQDPEFYSLMAQSLAPEIFGHEDVKKALLLLMIGGADIQSQGLKIRGNINVCLMGDPGVAKSQLLGFVHRLSPRSQYTTGRGSSGVGLTAAVLKDSFTGEMTLEAGALVLADRGICCIDEFDKMDESDRTAIHEVMEQQTISIAKAGIMTTLNARVAILSAANPAYGRYNPRKTVEQNVDLPAALLSRFDILWLIRDKPDRENDLRLAQHIAYVHMHNSAPSQLNQSVAAPTGDSLSQSSSAVSASQSSQNTSVLSHSGTAHSEQISLLSMQQLRRYIQACKNLTAPSVPPHLADYLVGAYVELRKEARNNKEMTFTSPRTLLGIIRLATAIARLRFRSEVNKYDIDEAMRLMEASRASVQADFSDRTKRATSYRDQIYQVIREMASSGRSQTIKLADVIERCATKGFKPDQVNEVIDNYESLNVWQVNTTRTRLTIVN